MTLAKTIFSGKGDDTLLTQDIYSIGDSVSKNAFKSVASVNKAMSSMVDSLKEKTGGIESILGKIDSVAGQAAKYIPDAMKLKDALGQGPAGALAALDNGLVQKLAGDLSIKPELLNNIKVAYGEVTQLMNGDYKSIAGVSSILQGLGSSQIVSISNLSDKVGLIGGMVDTLAESGGLEILEMIKDDASISDILPVALESNVGKLVAKTGVDGLNKVASIVGYENLGKDTEIFKKTLQGYAAKGSVMVKYSTDLAKTIQSFESVDENWKSVVTDPRNVSNLNHFVGLAGDVAIALRHDDDLGESFLAANMYDMVDMVDELKSMYKGAVV